ncbi:hypothetical protein PIB30_065474 [Stylosanthes scabra]|uniref:Uncharacterized protein n=1 Tax=Stylosanthes scabra TaxID=79078 RepID=A0ABU6ZKQ7_9FABA|nr:hypothetical protein [Stylosanthes scabra]
MLPPPEPKPTRTRRHPRGILPATLARQPNSLRLMVPHHAPLLLQRQPHPLRPQDKSPLVNRHKRRRHSPPPQHLEPSDPKQRQSHSLMAKLRFPHNYPRSGPELHNRHVANVAKRFVLVAVRQRLHGALR